VGSSLSVVFALVANGNSGAGHWMRCVSLANEFASAGHSVAFYGEVGIDWLAHEHSKSAMREKYQPKCKYDFLIIDSYDKAFILEARSRVNHNKSIQVLDSASPIINLDGAIWVDPYPVPTELVQKTQLIASGPTLLVSKSSTKFAAPPAPDEILVTLGGMPSDDLVQRVLKWISIPEFETFSFSLFSNRTNFNLSQKNIKLLRLSIMLDTVAASSGTIITNAGTSLWKFITLRRPIGMIKVAENQSANYEYASSHGLAIPLADFVKTPDFNTTSLLALVADTKLRDKLTSSQEKYLEKHQACHLINKIVSFGGV